MAKVLTILTAVLTSLALIGTAVLISQKKGARQEGAAQTDQPQPAPAKQNEVTFDLEEAPVEEGTVTISTIKGDIVVQLYPEEAPETVANFIGKAGQGFYDGLIFHRVEDWVVQGGDPAGDGTGGGEMETELNDVPFEIGSLGVARGMDIKISNDSQFFICTADCAWLTSQYTNFGKVIEGLEVAKEIEIGDEIVGIVVTTSLPGTDE